MARANAGVVHQAVDPCASGGDIQVSTIALSKSSPSGRTRAPRPGTACGSSHRGPVPVSAARRCGQQKIPHRASDPAARSRECGSLTAAEGRATLARIVDPTPVHTLPPYPESTPADRSLSASLFVAGAFRPTYPVFHHRLCRSSIIRGVPRRRKKGVRPRPCILSTVLPSGERAVA